MINLLDLEQKKWERINVEKLVNLNIMHPFSEFELETIGEFEDDWRSWIKLYEKLFDFSLPNHTLLEQK